MNNSNNILLYNRNKIFDIISCAICLEKFKHPRNLDCGHAFCTTCLHMMNINNEIVCPMCRKVTKFTKDKTLIDLPVNNILVSIIDETNRTSKLDSNNTNKLKLKKSKSVDSFVEFKKNKNKRNILYNNNIKILTNNLDDKSDDNDNNIGECNRECCSFQ